MILYIEDNADNQRLVQRILEARNYRVQLAENGPEGIQLALEGMPALILVDMNIPGLDGYETTTRLRSMAHLGSTPIVALTADNRNGTRERTLVAGCDGYITKPIDPRRLPEQIEEFINGKREAVPQALEAPLLREYNQKLVERLERQVRELSIANSELQEADRLKNQFLATLSHELRTPLTSLLGYLELFGRRTLGPLTEAQAEGIRVMTRSTEILARHVNHLLYLQEVRSSQLKREPCTLHTLLMNILEEWQPRIEAGNINLQTTIEPTATYMGDMLGLDQAIRNLLDNALKFTPPNGTVRVALLDEPNRIILRVEDSGPGIPPDMQDKVFLPFFQIDTSLARQHPGAGMGLAIVQHVVEAHGGQVILHSTLGQGSQFVVVLPRT
jgi:signal transduction histidine kinase